MKMSKSEEQLVLLERARLMDDEIEIYRSKISTYPYGAVKDDDAAMLSGIYGIYKVNKKFDFNYYNLDKKEVKRVVKANNLLVYKQHCLQAKAMNLSTPKYYTKKGSYSVEGQKVYKLGR